MNECIPSSAREAIRILGIYTAGRFDIWMLSGSHKASVRAHVMSALLGRRAIQRESGITALQSELYRQCNVQGDCIAAREDAFIALARGAV